MVHESVPTAASCVQPFVPLSTLSSNSTCVVEPVPHWPGPGCVVNVNTTLVVEPQSLFAVTRHQICVLSGSVALGVNVVSVTVCDRMMSLKSASVEISIRYEAACAAASQVNV